MPTDNVEGGVHNLKNEAYEAVLRDKRDELIWALSSQGYTPKDLSVIFNLKHISTITRAVERMPEDWVSPWVKRRAM